MPIVFESQIYAQCDCCGSWEARADTKMKTYVADLRKRGWSVGKKVLCPECKLKGEEK